MLQRSEQAYLVIGDISGYTGYLAGTELEHAQDVLADLMETFVKAVRPVLRLAKLEGDAAFTYALQEKVDGSMLLDTVESAYFAFRRRLQNIRQATTCRCNACVQIPNLNLKFFAHAGSFVRQRIMGREELAGTDVIIVHRLMKNTVTETTGLRGYALFTDACVLAMGLDPALFPGPHHIERYEHIGEVGCCVEDLEARWAEEQERTRLYIAPDDAEVEMSFEFPVPPPVLWEWLTTPAKRALYGADRVEQLTPGRRKAGVTNHCVHGQDVIVEEILDWRPFHYWTARYPLPPAHFVMMDELVPTDTGTRMVTRVQKMRGAKMREVWASAGVHFAEMARHSAEALGRLLTEQAQDDEPVTATEER